MTEQAQSQGHMEQPPERAQGQAAPITLMTAVTRFKGVETPGQRFEIDTTTSPITAGDLRTLAHLPYEVALHEDGGRTVLNRGDEDGATFAGATRESRWMLHTHPFGSENTNLSAADVLATWRHDHKNTVHMLVTERGITTYRAPQHEPDQPEVPLENILQPLVLWGGKDGFNLLNGTARDGRDVSDRELGEATRQFAEASGMIVNEASWDDQAGLDRALEILNGSNTKAIGDVAVEAARRVVDT